MKKTKYALFDQPISRRTYYWLWFLCPLAAMWILLASRRVVDIGRESAPSGPTSTH